MGGPLCEEPLMGCAFVITKFSLDDSEKDVSNDLYGPLSGQIVSIGKKETIISRIFVTLYQKSDFYFLNYLTIYSAKNKIFVKLQ